MGNHPSSRPVLLWDALLRTPLVVLLIGAGTACSPAEVGQSSSRVLPTNEVSTQPTHDGDLGRLLGAPGGTAASTAYRVSLSSSSHRQGYLYGDFLTMGGGRRFSLRNSFRNATTGFQWQTSYTEFSASFDIVHVCSSGTSAFYVLGRSIRNGTEVYVIESWQAIPAPSLMGEPPNYEMVRNEIYRDISMGPIARIEADPEARFLLVLHAVDPATGVGVLSKMELPGGQPISVVLPAISNIQRMSVVQHATAGRLWYLMTPGTEFVTTLFDHDNDGEFEADITLDYDTWELAGYLDDIVDDFIFR